MLAVFSGSTSSEVCLTSSSLLVVCSSSRFAHANPRSTLHVVRLSDFKASLATQCRWEVRHHLLRDVDASLLLLVSGFRRGWSSLHLWVQHWRCSGWCRRSGSTSTRRSCKLEGFLNNPNNVLLGFASVCCGTTL